MKTQTAITLPAMWKARDVQNELRMSRSKLDRLLADEESSFPQPFWVGGERYWLAERVRDWIIARSGCSASQGEPEKHAA
jgi:predicted DNA-binding transcriptional regulator AlpA